MARPRLLPRPWRPFGSEPRPAAALGGPSGTNPKNQQAPAPVLPTRREMRWSLYRTGQKPERLRRAARRRHRHSVTNPWSSCGNLPDGMGDMKTWPATVLRAKLLSHYDWDLWGKHRIGWAARLQGLWRVVQSPARRQLLQAPLGAKLSSLRRRRQGRRHRRQVCNAITLGKQSVHQEGGHYKSQVQRNLCDLENRAGRHCICLSIQEVSCLRHINPLLQCRWGLTGSEQLTEKELEVPVDKGSRSKQHALPSRKTKHCLYLTMVCRQDWARFFLDTVTEQKATDASCSKAKSD